jgi:hypothetical protein
MLGKLERQLQGVMLVVVILLGGVAYITYDESTQLALLRSQVSSLQTELSQQGSVPRSPLILLRTWGTGLASYIEGENEVTYLQLTMSGQMSGVESSFASFSFNASVAGNSVQWFASANSVAGDRYHNFWPMVLENAPNGTDAIEFEDYGGNQEIGLRSNGSAVFFPVSWSIAVPHAFKIVIVTPGKEINFSIDGTLVKSLVKGSCAGCTPNGVTSQTPFIPNVGFLIEGAEVDSSSQSAHGVATLEVYGGLLYSTDPDFIASQPFT